MPPRPPRALFGALTLALALASPAFAQESDPFEVETERYLAGDGDPFERLNEEYAAPPAADEPGAAPAPRPPEPRREAPTVRRPRLRPTGAEEGASASRLSDEAIGLQVDDVPERPTPLLELGNPFLGTGPIGLGFELPTGGVWQPSLLVYGTYRSGINVYEQDRPGRAGDETVVEWANRLDIFANLQLAGFANERLVFGMRPLDRALYGRGFTGYVFEPDRLDGEVNEFNDRVTALFFEGDLGEVLPGLDEQDARSLDIGFAVGRQALSFQSGILINDVIDAVGITRNNIPLPYASNLRVTALFGWNQIHRGNFARDDQAEVYGLLSSADLRVTTIDLDLLYVSAPADTGDGFYGGISATQRHFGSIATTLRGLVSLPTDGEASAANDRGGLIVLESSWTPTGTDDILFVNGYIGIDRFTSAARAPSTGGPLARVGILYAAIGLGGYPSALDGDPARSAGGSVGYQAFFDDGARQLIVEVGGRDETSGEERGMLAVGGRFQQGFWQRFILRADAFATKQERRQPRTGVHIELQIQF